MPKVTFDVFTEAIQKVVSLMSDDDKLEFYEELLETGSASAATRTVEHNFGIVDGLEYEQVVCESNPSLDDMKDLENDIDEIINTDYTDDLEIEVIEDVE